MLVRDVAANAGIRRGPIQIASSGRVRRAVDRCRRANRRPVGEPIARGLAAPAAIAAERGQRNSHDRGARVTIPAVARRAKPAEAPQ